jgi:uncharacterized membrane protein YeaQ/YmgE (transglycosylase-associated protein family)
MVAESRKGGNFSGNGAPAAAPNNRIVAGPSVVPYDAGRDTDYPFHWEGSSMDATAIVVMLVIGAIAGWLASLLVGGPWGLIGYIIAGVIGGVVGGWLLSTLKVDLKLGHPVINQIVTAAIGAIIVIILARLIV